MSGLTGNLAVWPWSAVQHSENKRRLSCTVMLVMPFQKSEGLIFELRFHRNYPCHREKETRA
ncbi:hypothetical protein BYT27DRAFT_7200822 [Phlegmacium glaucopus]|nr:hypothetical protein BYT27DRAFT_7200822 [Phlegmacium glaucopus]